jgi:transposase, IS5 family
VPEILGRVNAYLWSKGLMLKRGSIVDATIIANVEMVKELLRGKEEVVHADSGYTGADERAQSLRALV